jgi:hypothetical protein
VRVEPDVAHHLGEEVPFDLREGEEEMLVREEGVLASPRVFERTIDDALRGFSDLARRDIEIVHVHDGASGLRDPREQDARQTACRGLAVGRTPGP